MTHEQHNSQPGGGGGGGGLSNKKFVVGWLVLSLMQVSEFFTSSSCC
jgi:hypothetical protein